MALVNSKDFKHRIARPLFSQNTPRPSGEKSLEEGNESPARIKPGGRTLGKPSFTSLGLLCLCYNKVMQHNRIIRTISIIGLAVLFLMLIFTSPTEIGPFGVLLFFTTLYVAFFGALCLLLQAFKRIAFKKEKWERKDYLYAAVLAFGPIMLLMARSFGAVNLWTGGLIIVFLALAEFLVYKRI